MRFLKYTTILLLTMLLIGQIAQAQQGVAQVQGSVFGPDDEPAMYSTIMLLNKDSVLVKGALSQPDGIFVIDKIVPGDYFVRIRSIGFRTYTTSKLSFKQNDKLVLEKITLVPDNTLIKEAVATARKSMVEIQADKMKINVASSVNASGNNGMELLSKVPGIIVDMDKNIILQGKSGVQIYINGRPTRLSGNDLTNFLESLRSENIESMDIITNPSSKYDAEGTAGIINIVLKKNASLGFNGNATGSFSQGTFSRSSVGSSLNYSGNKINLFTSLNVSDNYWQNDFVEKTFQSGYLLDKNSKSKNNSKAVNFSGGMDYTINQEQSLSIDGRVLLNKRDNVLRSNTGVFDTTDLVNGEILRAQVLDKLPSENYILNASYRNALTKTSNLSADFSFGKYSSSKNTRQPNDYLDAVNGTILRTLNKEYDAKTQIDLLSFKTDYEKKFKKITLSSGAKYSYITTGNQLAFYNIENGQSIFDKTRSNDFNYLEKVAALYFILNANPTDKLMINAGLRLENTSSLGKLESEIASDENEVSRNYTDLFPTLGISFDDKKNNAISLSYGRRITRPNYQDLNPFESRMSELSAWKGNPFLKPNYIDNYLVSYSFKKKLVISNNYSITHDFFATIFEISQKKGNVLIPRNMQRATNNGLSVSYPLRIVKWWDLSSFFNYNLETYKGDLNGTKIDLKASTYNFRLQNNVQLPAAVIMELTYSLNSPWIWRGSVNVDGFSGLNIGAKREFMNHKLLVQLTANDIFNSMSDYHYKSNYGGMKVDGVISFDNQRAGISATYKFGNQKVKSRKKGKTGIDDELNRISE